MAFGAPRCAFFRRRNAPNALFGTVQCRRKAFAARFALGLVRDLAAGDPVVRAECQDAKCLALGCSCQSR